MGIEYAVGAGAPEKQEPRFVHQTVVQLTGAGVGDLEVGDPRRLREAPKLLARHRVRGVAEGDKNAAGIHGGDGVSRTAAVRAVGILPRGV